MCRSPRNRGFAENCVVEGSRRSVMAVEAGGSRGGGGGADQHGGGKKRYQRHTAEQIQILEETFRECEHPDEKLRAELSQEMGLTTRQIKFWFQNRRTQLKAKSEMKDICMLKTENDKMRSENIAIREALKNAKCSSCGGPHTAQAAENCQEEQSRLRYENAQLKEELERISGIIANYIGPLTSQFPTANIEQSHLSSEKLSTVTTNKGDGGDTQERTTNIAASDGPSLDLDLVTTTGIKATATATNNTLIRPTPSRPLHGGMHKSLIVDIMNSALDELMQLFQTDDPLWTKLDGRDVLDINVYKHMFPRPNSNTSMKKPYLWVEASRATAYVMMDSMQLVEMFNDSTKWGDLFPTIVLKARSIKVISSGFFRNPSGSLQLMYEELQMASPLVPIRQFVFLRFCQQIDQTTWAIVDFSYDHPQVDHNMPNMPYSYQCNSRRLPSGCLIQRMPNGCSKVTWVEHVEVEDKVVVPMICRDLIYNGLAFGAERWIACLQRSCEKIVCQTMKPNSLIFELGGVIPSDEGRKSVMKLAKRMMNNFCARIIPSSCDGHLWSCVSDFDNFEVYATLYKSADADSCGHPNTTVLGAAATVWLPHSPQFVFDFLRDERNRPQWDVLAYRTPVQEVTHIANGAHPGNCISILQGQNTRSGNIMILQESCTTTDSSGGSLVVYCPVDLPVMNIIMSGEEPDRVPLLLPSGFFITTDGGHHSSSTISTSGGGGGGGGGSGPGSLVTVVAQMMVSGLPWGKIGPQSVATVNNLIGTRVRHIKRAMNGSSSAST